MQSYLDRTITEAAVIAECADAFQKAFSALSNAAAPYIKIWQAGAEPAKERDDAAATCFASLKEWTARISKEWTMSCPADLASQHARLSEIEHLATACRDLVKDVDLVAKLASRLVGMAEKELRASRQNGEAKQEEWDGRAIGRLEKELDVRRKALVEQLKRTAYFQRQAQWLLSRFPDATFIPVAGLCRIVNRTEIAAADWSLTPGRYVGVAPPEVDEDFDFEQALRDIHIELADLNRDACALATKIQANFEGLGI